jgi:hypothetical protein
MPFAPRSPRTGTIRQPSTKRAFHAMNDATMAEWLGEAERQQKR